MRARDQSSIFSTGGEILPWLWASIGVTRSYSSRPFLCALALTHLNHCVGKVSSRQTFGHTATIELPPWHIKLCDQSDPCFCPSSWSSMYITIFRDCQHVSLVTTCLQCDSILFFEGSLIPIFWMGLGTRLFIAKGVACITELAITKISSLDL